MKINELIERLEELVKHGVSPDAVVSAWDPEEKEFLPVTGMVFNSQKVDLYTDTDDGPDDCGSYDDDDFV